MAANIYDLLAQNKGMVATPWGLQSPDLSYKRYTEDEANETFDTIRKLPEYQAQQAGVSDMEQELERLKRLPQVSGDTWQKPLLALVDSQTGSNLSKAYQENDVSQKTNEQILKYQDALANRKKQQAETLMSGLNKFKSGTTTTKDTGISPIEQAKLDLDKAKAQQQAELEQQKIDLQRAKGTKETFTPAEKARDIQFGKDVDPYLGGGRSRAEDMVSKIDEVIDDIKKGNLNTGLLASGFGWNTSVTESGKKAKNVADMLSMENMRATFGSQFTENEGVLLRKSNLDTTASSQQNIANLMTARNMIANKVTEMDSKISHYEQDGVGTLKGYKSSAMKQAKSDPAPQSNSVSQGGQYKAAGAKFTRQDAIDYAKEHKMTYTQAVHALEKNGYVYGQ